MIENTRIVALAQRLVRAYDDGEGADVACEYNGRAFAFMLRQLTDEEFAAVESKPGFIYEDHSNDPVWEKCQDLLVFWEDWSYGGLVEDIVHFTDDKTGLADQRVWEWILQRAQFSRKDYEFCQKLLATADEELCWDYFQGWDGNELKNHPRWAEFQAVLPGHDPSPLWDQLNEIYGDWEAVAKDPNWEDVL